MISWLILGGITVAMFVIIYKYEQKLDAIQKQILENKKSIETNQEKITQNHEVIHENKSKIKENYSHIERMWVTIPKRSEKES